MLNRSRASSLLEDFSELVYCNPFTLQRREIEARLLGTRRPGVWTVGQDGEHLNALRQLAEQTLTATGGVHERHYPPALREDLAFYVLYYRHVRELEQLLHDPKADARAIHQTLRQELADFRIALDAAEVIGRFFQIRRAFEGIYGAIVGHSAAAAQLRACIWESIFTHNPRRFWKSLPHRAADFPTLISGPSGTGKELVARAIAMGRFIPYNARQHAFEFHLDDLMLPLNLAALSPTLIESELFGHRRGAFTGALEDRAGYLEACHDRGVVFLDEIGELEGSLQVKLLRVLQENTFQRIGETRARPFRGKIVAATNRDLSVEMQAGRFRRDLYYRLCADTIETPPLAELIDGDRDELRRLIAFIAEKLLPEPAAREELIDQTLAEIAAQVGWEYHWPGNFRELEQCTRNVFIRGRYRPLQTAPASSSLGERLDRLELSADGLLDQYCRHAYQILGSYRAAAERLQIDRRTLKARATRA